MFLEPPLEEVLMQIIFLFIFLVSCGDNRNQYNKDFKSKKRIFSNNIITVYKTGIKSQLNILDSSFLRFEEVSTKSSFNFEILKNKDDYYLKPLLYLSNRSDREFRLIQKNIGQKYVKIKFPMFISDGLTEHIKKGKNDFIKFKNRIKEYDIDFAKDEINVTKLNKLNGCPKKILLNTTRRKYEAKIIRYQNNNCELNELFFVEIILKRSEFEEFLQNISEIELVFQLGNRINENEFAIDIRVFELHKFIERNHNLSEPINFNKARDIIYRTLLENSNENINIPYHIIIEQLINNIYYEDNKSYYLKHFVDDQKYSYRWNDYKTKLITKKILLSIPISIEHKLEKYVGIKNDEIVETRVKVQNGDKLHINLTESSVFFKGKLINYIHPSCLNKPFCIIPSPKSCFDEPCSAIESLLYHKSKLVNLELVFKNGLEIKRCLLSDFKYDFIDSKIVLILNNSPRCLLFEDEKIQWSLAIHNNLSIKRKVFSHINANGFGDINVVTKEERGVTMLNLDLKIYNYNLDIIDKGI